MEIYPPESQLVDGANQYHLWIIPSFDGIGFHSGRSVCYESDPREPFHRQAPLPPGYPVYGPVETVDEIYERKLAALREGER